MYAATDVAKYIVSRLDQPDAGEPVTHLKLQKLLYYAQGIHLALKNEPLFRDQIRAWDYGPVVKSVWDVYRDCGRSPIPAPEISELPEFDYETMSILNDVVTVFGQFSASALMRMTHSEPPWKATPRDGAIDQEAMRAYFVTQLIG